MGQNPSDIRAELEETRSRVGDEVDALSYKTDVSARVGDYVDEKKQAVKDTHHRRQGQGDRNRLAGNAERRTRQSGQGHGRAQPDRSCGRGGRRRASSPVC